MRHAFQERWAAQGEANPSTFRFRIKADHQSCFNGRFDPWQLYLRRSLLKGIGIRSSWLYVHEFFGWRKFQNRREVGSLAGLAPTPYASGQIDRDQGISKAGNKRMRWMAVEIAWGWLHFQPESALSRWFYARFGRGSSRQRRIGIVALARKLLVQLWKYLETGVPPAGATLTDWRQKARITTRSIKVA